MVELVGIYKRGISSLLKKCEVEEDIIDLKSEWDKELNYEENKNHIIEILKQMGKWQEEVRKTVKEVKEEVENYSKQQIEQEKHHYKEELEKDLETIRKSIVDTSEFYGSLKQKIEMVKQNYIHSLFVVGDSGCGKTTFITSQFDDGSLMKQTGHISPFKLYMTLYENKDGKNIYFDDTESLLENEDSKVLIKQATDTVNKRIVMWNTSKDLGTTPDWFILNSNIIFALNSITQQDESMKAIINRAEKVELNFNWEDYLKIMTVIAKKPREVLGKTITPEKRLEIVNFIKEHSDETTESFSLRTQFKVENYYVFDKENWQKYALELLSKKVDELKILKELLNSGKSVKDQVREFNERTGRSRATYYNLKKKLKSKV